MKQAVHREYINFVYTEDGVTRTSLFLSNTTQALRLPKDVAFPPGVKDVVVLREGARRIIVPADALWDDFFAAPGADLGQRQQPPPQNREAL